MMMQKIVLETHCGMMREINQDTAKAGKLSTGEIWAVVCDGMGGAAGGEVASKIVADCFEELIDTGFSHDFSINSIKNFLITAVLKANALVMAKAEESPLLQGMGTTVVACIVKDDTACIVHVGDSRAYLHQNETLQQITKDHSMVQVLLEQGQLTPEQAKHHPKKNVITRVVGVDRNLQVDYDEIYLEEDQKLLLCTDGLTNMLTDIKIGIVLASTPFFETAPALVKLANMAGGSDNITVVVIG